MGSGSSKSRRRAIKVCSQQPLDPTELSRGHCVIEGRVACEQMERDKDKGIPAKSSMSTLETEGGRLTAKDTDLQLLDDVLAESEGCFSWQESTRRVQMMRDSTYTNSNPGSLSQVQQNQSQDTGGLRMLHNTPELELLAPECKNTPNRHQTMSDNCNNTVPDTDTVKYKVSYIPMKHLLFRYTPLAIARHTSCVTKSTLDIENNNLSKFPHTCSGDMEAPDPVLYDDTEEALMDSIEQDFSHFQPSNPVCKNIRRS
ncbi:uncharacterized protein LOC142142636 isoform X1 [Mixophyes fleayi]|uniref:uncharacterized protein LOC142142636 isoform X1 n=1 Tax=Mixophyes fleayi TaxID=3061075 RepID=UPI003F4D73E5